MDHHSPELFAVETVVKEWVRHLLQVPIPDGGSRVKSIMMAAEVNYLLYKAAHCIMVIRHSQISNPEPSIAAYNEGLLLPNLLRIGISEEERLTPTGYWAGHFAEIAAECSRLVEDTFSSGIEEWDVYVVKAFYSKVKIEAEMLNSKTTAPFELEHNDSSITVFARELTSISKPPQGSPMGLIEGVSEDVSAIRAMERSEAVVDSTETTGAVRSSAPTDDSHSPDSDSEEDDTVEAAAMAAASVKKPIHKLSADDIISFARAEELGDSRSRHYFVT